jgi:hypothetical protein
VLLALVGLKLLAGELLHVGPLASLLAVLLVLGCGVAISLKAGPAVDQTPPGEPRY